MIVRVNGEPCEVEDGATVAAVVEGMGRGGDRRGVAVAVDAEVVPRSQWERRSLHEGARDHEPVAAVVAPAAEDGHAALEQVAVHRLHGGDHLAARVLHEHERRDADLLDRPPIGLTHLGGIQDPHQRRFKINTKDTKDTKEY